ncbi:hypothetical protein CDL12_19705 [Handroanthus impetiginosus]|uniref:C2 domain-containing protein n=1 Tax=Handroanthus impetiginosus TaxID=429701 RepID=A0A2G9GR02_9LAMI|nr:hypothetical protein CDL12_19705 [Handroanthus impetiginosus]
MLNNNIDRPPILEITVLSAQGLMRKSSLAFSRRLRPFITLSAATAGGGRHCKTYRTRVDEKGGLNPTWGDKFQLPIDQSFFYPGIYLQLYTKNLLMGRTQLGWCLIPAADIVNRFSPVGSTGFLSYRLREKDGSRGHGVVNVAVRLEGLPVGVNVSEQFVNVGIPVKL